MKIEQVREALSDCGYSVHAPTNEEWLKFTFDMDPRDWQELGMTRSRDAQKALDATFAHSTYIYAAHSDDHEGYAMFGLTKINQYLGQIWLLQSRTFANEAQRHHGRAWPIIGSRMVKRITALAQETSPTVMNFIPKDRDRNIRLLKLGGFEFFEHPEHETRLYFFAAGPAGEHLAKQPNFWYDFLGDTRS